MDNSVTGVLVAGAILLTLCIVLGLVKVCCGKSKSDPDLKLAYPVAISNRLFNDSEIGKDLPCLHCQLIEMGEMACYQEFCPHCGRVPPNRKTHEDQYLEAQGYHRRLVVLENENALKLQKQQQKQLQQQQQQQFQQQQIQQQQNHQLKQQNQNHHPDQIQIVGEKGNQHHRNQAEV